MKTLRAVHGWILLIATLRASEVRADFREWTPQCTPGAFQACASLSIGFLYDPLTDRTAVTVRMANLQGLPWLADPGPWGWRAFELAELIGRVPAGWDPPPTFVSSFAVPATLEGNGYLKGAFVEMFARFGQPGQLFLFGQNGIALWGCDGIPAVISPSLRFAWTCGGTIVLSFGLPGDWDLTDQTTVNFVAETVDPYRQIQCTFDTDCVVTPEPLTISLMATGLFGVAGMRLSRRRRTSTARRA